MCRLSFRIMMVSAVAVGLGTLVGCSDQGKYAEAYLRVHRDAFDGNTDDFQLYKKTQCALLSSPLVLQEATTGEDAAELARELDVKSGNDELLVIRLPVRNRTPEEAENLLNSILESYQREVVNRERLELVTQLSRLRKRYQSCYDSLEKSTEQVERLAKMVNDPEASGFVGTQLEVERQHLQYLRQLQVELKLDRSQVEAEGATESSQSAVATRVLDAKLQLVSEMIDESEAKLEELLGGSGELEARKADLDERRRELQKIGSAKLELEMRIDEHERVSIIQTAVVK